MSTSGPPTPKPNAEADDAGELRVLFALQRELKNVGSFDRLMHVALRILAPHFDAPHAVVFTLDRGGKLRIVHQLGSTAWNHDKVAQILSKGRATSRETTLYATLRERGKIVAALLLERAQAFDRTELRALLRLTTVINERLDALAELRVIDVLARIDRKISSELRTVDLLYQILDGLEMLVRYDHSGSLLLVDPENSQLVVRAEKIVWRKMKSSFVSEILPMDAGLTDLLRDDSRAFLLDASGQGIRCETHPLCEVCSEELKPASEEALQTLYLKLCYSCRKGEGPPEKSMMIVPLLFGQRVLGLLKLSALHEHAFTPMDVIVVGRFVEKMATAIRNANLYERRLDELRAINEIGKLVTRQMPLEETCQNILEIVLRVMNLKIGSIELLDRDQGRLHVLAVRGYPSAHAGLGLGQGITGEVARSGEPILANDVSQHPYYVRRCSETRSELAVPILFEGVCLGVLNVESYALNRFRDRDVQFLSILADKTATALETLEQSAHRKATLQLLYELSAKLAVPESALPLLQLTVDLSRKHLSCEVASIFLFEKDHYVRRATAGVEQDWFADESFGSGEGLTGKAAVLRPGAYPKPVIENDVGASPRVLPRILERYRHKLATGRIAHLIAVPLIEEDRPIGILRVINRITRDGSILPGGFTKMDVTLLSTIASQVSVALANFRKRERIQILGERLEAQVRERTEEVQRLATFVENAPLAIFWIDATGTLQFINEAGERMFGYQADELRGRRVDEKGSSILGTSLEDLEKVVGFMNNWTGEIECRRSNGEHFPTYLSARALVGKNDEPSGMVVFARDASAMKNLERQLLESEGKRAMADLAGGVAHDLNNALGSSLPMIQALKEDLEEGRLEPEQFLEDLRQIESYTRLSVRIFQGMLSMARGTFAIDQKVTLNERIAIAQDLLSLRLDKGCVRVVRNLDEKLPLMLAHPGRLEQAFHNLMMNAIDAMPDGGTLTLRTRLENGSIFAEVEDTGVGIEKELLERVEEPFYTSKGHGTGLGLSVVRSIVWEHNGKMTLRSEVGKGTTVQLEFPVYEEAEQDQEQEDGA